jgi:hypothetical protein
MPSTPGDRDSTPIARMLAGKRIAVVGLSEDPGKPSYYVSQYMRERGYEVVPVNPNHATVMGLKCYPTLADVPGRVDIVNVFRRPEFCAAIAEEAAAARAKGVWLQAGIRSVEARRIAEEAGMDYVENHCIMVEHMHHV